MIKKRYLVEFVLCFVLLIAAGGAGLQEAALYSAVLTLFTWGSIKLATSLLHASQRGIDNMQRQVQEDMKVRHFRDIFFGGF